MAKHSNRMVGIALVIAGSLFTITSSGIFNIERFWPILLLLIGAALMLAFIKGPKQTSLLFSGIVLVSISIIFQYCAMNEWSAMSLLWPLFLLAVGIGFLAEYFFVAKDNTRLSLGVVLAASSLVLFAMHYFLGRFWPVLLIVIGIIFIALSYLNTKKSKPKGDENK